MVQEFGEIMQPDVPTSRRFALWWEDTANRFDFFSVLLFFIAFVYRLAIVDAQCFLSSSEECCPMQVNVNFQWVQIMYSCSYIVFTIRILNFYFSRLVIPSLSDN